MMVRVIRDQPFHWGMSEGDVLLVKDMEWDVPDGIAAEWIKLGWVKEVVRQ